MASLGEKLTDTELDEMVTAARADGDGRIDYKGFVRTMMVGRSHAFGLCCGCSPVGLLKGLGSVFLWNVPRYGAGAG